MKKNLRLIITLALVAAIATGLLSVVNDITAPIIKEGDERRLQAALSDVVDAETFEAILDEEVEEGEEEVVLYYEAYTGTDLVGYAVSAQGKGYGTQPIRMLVGMDAELNITGIRILSHNETPGLGDAAFASSWLEQFLGKGFEDPIAAGEDIDIISGATSSSMGVIAGVNSALNTIAGELGLITAIDFTVVPDGTYEGTGRGFVGEINVKITIAGGELTDIEVLSHSESPGYSDPAFANIPDRIIEEQSVEVDAASGATVSSNGIMDAVRNALVEFFGGEEDVVEPVEPVVLSEVANGRYRGEGEGFSGDPIIVEVMVQDGVITDLEIISENDSADWAPMGINAMTERLIGSNSLDVDTTSGATWTAKGILAAVEDALRGDPIIDLSNVENGTYSGEAEGFMGPIKVDVTVQNGVITAIEYVSMADETPDYASTARSAMNELLIGSDSLDVDTKTGATYTSEGIINAIKNALATGLQ